VKDMMTSFYHYIKSFKTIGDIHSFIRDEEYIGVIKNQNENFKDTFTVNYEDLIKNYEETINNISNYIGMDSKKIVDVRNKKEGSISSVFYRKGVVGDYKNYLNEEDIKYIDNYMK
jgi:hypothetical protein